MRLMIAALQLFFDYRYDSSVDNDFIVKPAKTVAWMSKSSTNNKKLKIRKKSWCYFSLIIFSEKAF